MKNSDEDWEIFTPLKRVRVGSTAKTKTPNKTRKKSKASKNILKNQSSIVAYMTSPNKANISKTVKSPKSDLCSNCQMALNTLNSEDVIGHLITCTAIKNIPECQEEKNRNSSEAGKLDNRQMDEISKSNNVINDNLPSLSQQPSVTLTKDSQFQKEESGPSCSRTLRNKLKIDNKAFSTSYPNIEKSPKNIKNSVCNDIAFSPSKHSNSFDSLREKTVENKDSFQNYNSQIPNSDISDEKPLKNVQNGILITSEFVANKSTSKSDSFNELQVDTFQGSSQSSRNTPVKLSSSSKTTVVVSDSKEINKVKQWETKWWLKSNANMGETSNSPASTVKNKEAKQNVDEIKLNMNEPIKQGRQTRACPFYKLIPGTFFAVDAFSYGVIMDVTAYFLSHFHSDHYMGLNRKFTQPIYCSKVTANLVNLKLKVPWEYLHPLALNTPHLIDGIEVTLLEANHCPGAVMFLFKRPNKWTILHTGDFRAHPSMELYSPLKDIIIDKLYLDTTYCQQQYDFPSQEEIISAIKQVVRQNFSKDKQTLIVCGSYTIGKEKVFKAISEELNEEKVVVSSEKYRVLCCLEDKELRNIITTDESKGRIHVLPMMALNVKKLKEYLNKFSPTYNKIVAFRPTGWEYKNKKSGIHCRQTGSVIIYGVPYSEHSSYKELERFIKFFCPKQIIPTVNNGNPYQLSKMKKIFDSWKATSLTAKSTKKNSLQSYLISN